MKIKGVNWFEQNIEKVVLAAVALVLLGVVTMQALVQPNMVKVGRAAPVPPGQAFRVPATEATRLASLMDRVENVETPEAPMIDLVERFRARRARGPGDAERFAALGRPVDVGVGAAGLAASPMTDGPIATVVVPAPTGPSARAFWSAISPSEVVRRPALASLLPASQPFDKLAVTIEAQFDGTALARQLATDPDGPAGPVRVLPTNWWRDAIEVVGVQLQREEWVPSSGTWTDTTIVPTVPGAVDVIAEINSSVRATTDLEEAARRAQRLAPEVRTPRFLEIIAGEPWIAPSEAGEQGALDPAVDRLVRQRKSVRDEIGRIQNRLRELGDAAAREQGREGGHGDTGAGGGRGGVREGGQRDSGAASRDDRLRDQLRRTLEERQREDQRLTTELEQLGYRGEAGAVSSAALVSGPPTMTLQDKSMRLWAHDLTAVPGKVYRYRMRVVINNPMFGRSASLNEQQQGLAKSAVLEGEWSAWTQPIEALNKTYYFVASASEPGALGTARAVVEVYTMFYGYYRRGSVALEPGDRVSTAVSLPESSKLPIWDMEKLKGRAPGTDRPGVGQPTLPPGQEGGPVRGGHGGHGGAPPPETTPEQGVPTRPIQGGLALEGATFWSQPVSVGLDVCLLDVAQSPVMPASTGLGTREPPSEVFLRVQDGRIVVRSADTERTGPIYVAVSQSARAGQAQGVVEPTAPGTPETPGGQPIGPGGRDRERQPPPPPPPGGGGGGGG